MKMNSAMVLMDAARVWPTKVAVIDGQARYSYRDVDSLANRVANGLRAAGVDRGDRVAFSCPNSVHFLAIYFGAIKLGAVAVPINLMLRQREIEYLLAHSGAVAYVCHAGSPTFPAGQEGYAAFANVDTCKHFWMIPGESSDALPDTPHWDSLVDHSDEFESVWCSADEPAEFMYSSGTTGHSKGAVHNNGPLIFNVLTIREQGEYAESDIVLAVTPFFNGYGRGAVMLPTILAGGTLVVVRQFKPSTAWADLLHHKATVFPGVPMMYAAMLQAEPQIPDPASLSHWRLALSAGAILPSGLQEAFKARTGITIRQVYGMAEALVVSSHSPSVPVRPGSVGHPRRGNVVRCLDDQKQPLPSGAIGDLVVRSPGIMAGYFNDPVATGETLQQDWLNTGDRGFIDEDGEIHIVGRKKEMISRGGNHVYPAEVEQALLTHPGIANAAVIGAPDERLGEEVCAFVTLKEGVTCDSEELIAWARENIAAHAWPRRMYILPALPLGPMGKILKKELQEMLAQMQTNAQRDRA